MSEEMKETKKYVTRSSEERIAEIEEKISKHKLQIKALEAKIEEIKHPKVRISKAKQLKAVMDAAKKTMTPEEIAEKLGIKL